MECSIARSMAVAGEPWSPLLLRDIYMGTSRFDDLQTGLGISRKVLSERLGHLVDAGMLERRPYSQRPLRHEYVLTRMGIEFVDVLMAMVAWGDRWTAGEAGPPVLYRHRACGSIAHVEPTLLGVRRAYARDRHRRRARPGLTRPPGGAATAPGR